MMTFKWWKSKQSLYPELQWPGDHYSTVSGYYTSKSDDHDDDGTQISMDEVNLSTLYYKGFTLYVRGELRERERERMNNLSNTFTYIYHTLSLNRILYLKTSNFINPTSHQTSLLVGRLTMKMKGFHKSLNSFLMG